MNPRRPFLLLLLVIVIILILGILLRTSCCRLLCKKEGYLAQDTTLYLQTIGWNVLFKENVSNQRKEKVIEGLQDSIKKFYTLYNSAYGTFFTPKFEPTTWCPCDSALYAISFTAVDGTGKSVSSPPPTKPVGGSGDLEDILTISNNMVINEPNKTVKDSLTTYVRPRDTLNYTTGYIHTSKPVTIRNTPVDPTKILAIMDSGIDSTKFDGPVQQLMWKAPPGMQTLYNFIPHQPVADKFDSGFTKHGSAVTAVAIDAMKNSATYPRLMILKTLDKDDRGSTFAVSCALSYAIQNHATLVNISLGYKGKADSVLRHYIELCAKHKPFPIQLFAAAGNTHGGHDDALICSNDFNNNLLTVDSLFYPACFSKEFTNITSVTQMQQPGSACYYQYFSKEYISLGVLNNSPNPCCSFEVEFRINNRNFYEGSSFATPVASGFKMATILQTENMGLTNPMWEGSLQTTASNMVTINGKYIIH